MHRIEIYDKNFNALTTVFPPFVYDIEYTQELSKSGSAKFKIRVIDANATATNLKLYNRVKIYRDSVGVFIGYIENLKADLNEIEVDCQGMLGFFSKRLYTKTISNTNAGTACSNVFAALNAIDDTGITFGASDLTYVISQINFSRSSALDVFEKIANMSKSEIEITTDREFNINSRVGVDKTSTIIFQYISTQINASTIFDFDVEIQGKDMANYVVGISSNLNSTQQDATSIADFGLLQEFQNFAQTGNQTNLDAETLNYLATYKNEFYVPKVSPNPNKIDVDSYEVGDSVRVVISHGFIAANQTYRIIKKTVKVSENQTLEVSINLTPEDTNVLPSSFFDEINDIRKRVSLLESAI